MPAKAPVASDKELYWRAVMKKFKESGVSGAEFCRSAGHNYTAFADWRQRLRRKEKARKPNDSTSEREWISIIDKARAYPTGVQQYCEDHGICTKNYYRHFRRLKSTRPDWSPLQGRKSIARSNTFQETNGKLAAPAATQPSTNDQPAPENFVPVHVIADPPSGSDTTGPLTVDVILPSSIAIRIGVNCPLDFLKEVVSTLGAC